ncbi:hypothetical protein [Burkholderia sp. PU8-34]
MDMVAPFDSFITFAAPANRCGGVPADSPGARCVFYAIPAQRSRERRAGMTQILTPVSTVRAARRKMAWQPAVRVTLRTAQKQNACISALTQASC